MKITIVLIPFLLLLACAQQPVSNISNVAGFLSGCLHGLLIVPSLIGAMFLDVRIYEFPNSGWFYDFGFLIGIMSNSMFLR